MVVGVDATKASGLAVGELVHGLLGDVETVAGAVDSKNVDGVAVVGDAVASTTLLDVSFLYWWTMS